MSDDRHAQVDDRAAESERPGRAAFLTRLALDVTPLRTSKDFRRLWLGTGISAVGSQITLVAIWSLPPVPAAEESDRPGLRSVLEGLRYVRTKPVLLGIFLVDTIAMIFGMPSALFPAFAEHLGGSARTVGLLYSAPYAGAFAATVLSGWIGHVRRQGLGVYVAAGLWGVAIALVGAADAVWLALLLLAIAGAADYVSAVLRSTILLAATPDALRGRLSGIELAQVAGAPSLGNVEAGVVASLAGVRFSIVSGGVACVVGTIAITLAVPALLRYDSREVRS